MRKNEGTISISRHLARRAFPVAFAIGFLISMGFPSLYAYLEFRSLRHSVAEDAQELAAKLKQIIAESPQLWKYQSAKDDRLLQDFIPFKDVSIIRIYDESGRLLSRIEGGEKGNYEFWKLYTVTGKAPLLFNNERVGTVVVEASAGSLIEFTAIFFIISSLIATSFTSIIYFFPVTVVRNLEGEILSLNETLEQRVAERTAQLEAANGEMESFSYSISHDLRAPLRHISGFSVALLEDYGEKLEGEPRDYLNRICSASKRMDALIEALLKLSRINRSELTRELIDLSSVARTVADDLRQTDPVRRATFRIQEGVKVTGDPPLIRNVMENLLGNAWKFTSRRDEAVIEFGTVNDGEKELVFVRDNGAGFDMAFAERLFGPFQRFHTAEEFEGTGIGLATVQRIIHRHGGLIRAESSPGKGTTFYFTV